MGFEKGHKLAKGGARAGAGRKKNPSTLIKEAIARNDERLPELFDILYAKAQGRDNIECPYCKKKFVDPVAGDREAIINLIDRSLGKVRAKTELELDIGGGELLGAGTVAQIFQIMAQKRRELLEEGKDAEG